MSQIQKNNKRNVTSIVVDDNADIRYLFVELLQMHDVTVLGTGVNGHEAFELYQKYNPDIVFLDIQMPNYDGFYGLEKIREFDPQAKVILVTGSIVNKTQLDNADFSEIIEKPIHIDQVVSIVDDIMSCKTLN